MEKDILVGLGNIGKALHAGLEHHPKLLPPSFIFTSKYVLDKDFEVVDSVENFGKYTQDTRFASLLLTLNLAHITYIVGYGPTGARDIALAITCFAIFLNGADEYTLDSIKKKE